MRIISPFKDYYDLYYVEENPLIYVRNTSNINIKFVKPFSNISIIGFCGQLHFIYQYYNHQTKEWYCSYDINDFNDFFHYHFDRDLERIPKEEIKSWFLKYRVPIFYLNKELILNPKLSELNFSKVKNAIEAYQEIELYLGNILLSEEKSSIPLTDKEKIVNKGFDLKHSFRKRKKKDNG